MTFTQKGEWKDVPIEARYFSDKTFSGFGSIKVLTNYELVRDSVSGKTSIHPKAPEKKEEVDKLGDKRSGNTDKAGPKAKKGGKVDKPGPKKGGKVNKPGLKNGEKVEKTGLKAKKGGPLSPKTVVKGDETSEKSERESQVRAKRKEKKKRQKKRKAAAKKIAAGDSDSGKEITEKSTDSTGEDGKSPSVVKEDQKQSGKKALKRKPEGEIEDAPKKKKQKQKKPQKKSQEAGNQATPKPDVKTSKPKKKVVDMSRWKDLFVPQVVLDALADVGFDTPTPIQCLALPPAIRDRMDILGAAETGSGKTLSFGIPMIHNILKYKEMHADDTSENEGEESEDDSIGEGEELLDEEYQQGSGEEAEEEQDEDEEGEANGGSEVDEDIIGERDVEYVDVDDEDEGVNEDELDDDDEEGGSEELDPEANPEQEIYDLADGELGCVAAYDNVKFDWLNDEKAEADAAVFNKPPPGADPKKPLFGFVLTPTRELAIQVRDHLLQACSHTDIKVVAIVGGMAPQKQERLLNKCPEIVVATPGRFWELLEEGNPHLAKVVAVRTLVFDEADRMVEKGHFEEVKKFLEFLYTNSKVRRQTFVYSATLTLVHETPNRLRHKKRVEKLTPDMKLGSLMELIGIDKKAKIIDLTRKVGTAETLVESKINCTKEEKDVYLHYFLQQYPGRTLIFTNSKDCLRRLVSILTVLQCNPLPLHADMHQRQRLKNLDRFRADSKGVLVATDVAARGLDIPDVQHVIHYQVPRTSENYVHRSGRTARAAKEGLSIMLVGPDDLNYFKKIVKTLNRDEDLASFPVEQETVDAVRIRVGLALKIDKAEHSQTKMKKENLWFQKAAEEMDIELDETELLNDLGDDFEQSQSKQRVAALRKELKFLLSQPIIPKRFSGKYPTKSGALVGLDREQSVGACAAAKKEASNPRSMKLSKIKRLSKQKSKGKKGKGKK